MKIKPTIINKLQDEQISPFAVKESRADFTYYPKVKELKDVICMPNFKIKEEVKTFINILSHYENRY